MVYLAEQEAPIRRRLALKVIKLTDPQLLAKAVELARQALAAAPTNGLLPWYQIALGVAGLPGSPGTAEGTVRYFQNS